MKFRILQSIFSLVLLVFLSACNDQLVSNFKLISDSTTLNAAQIAVAVDAKGWKHAVWNECDGSSNGNCRLVYARYLFSMPGPADLKYFIPYTSDYSYVDPDIAVTDGGEAYVAWRLKNSITGEYLNCWANVSYLTACTIFDNSNPNALASFTAGPRVVARGSTVYGVYEIKNGSGTNLWYRQLFPLDHSKGRISDADTTIFNTHVDVAISPEGTLHATWTNGAIKYADNVGTTGDMVHKMTMSSSTHLNMAPKITMDEGPKDQARLYIVQGIENIAPASDEMQISHCLYSDCTNPANNNSVYVNLNAGTPWIFHRVPAVAAVGSGSSSYLYGAFMASNAVTGGTIQLFQFGYHFGDLGPTATMLTNGTDYPDVKTSPRLIAIHDTYKGTPITRPVIAWRSEAFGGNNYHVFLYDISKGIRKVFTSPNASYTAGENTFDLAGNGKLGGGVWIDAFNSQNLRRTPWTSMNAIQVFIPQVNK